MRLRRTLAAMPYGVRAVIIQSRPKGIATCVAAVLLSACQAMAPADASEAARIPKQALQALKGCPLAPFRYNFQPGSLALEKSVARCEAYNTCMRSRPRERPNEPFLTIHHPHLKEECKSYAIGAVR